MSVVLVCGRSGFLYESEVVPVGEPDIVTLGPFEYVELTYQHLRVDPDGEQIGGFRDGYWWLKGDNYPFSDLDIKTAEPVAEHWEEDV